MKPETLKLLQDSPEYSQLIEQAHTLHQKVSLPTDWIENYSQLPVQSKTQIEATVFLIMSLLSVGVNDYQKISTVLQVNKAA